VSVVAVDTWITYQHVLPRMQDDVARAFATILAGNVPRRDPVQAGSDPVEGVPTQQ
jgi:hypothetical protein